MASVNKVILLGNVGKDPEVRYLPSGKAVANISIATSTKRKDKNSGESIEETQWHRIQMFDKLAEITGEYVKKGSQIYVEGSIKYGKFKNKDGVEQNTVEIVASSMVLLGRGTQNPDNNERQSSEPTRKAKPDFDDDMQF